MKPNKKNKKKKNTQKCSEPTSKTIFCRPGECLETGSEGFSCTTSERFPSGGGCSGLKCGISTSTQKTYIKPSRQQKDVEYRRLEKTLLNEGFYNTHMMYGYVCAMREFLGLPPYKYVASMENAITRNNLAFKWVVMGCGGKKRKWFKKNEIGPALCQIRAKDHDAFLSLPASDEELASGDFLDINACARLTGIKKTRISKIGSNNLALTRLHPVTNDRLYFVPGVRERGYFRDLAFIRKHFGDIAADALLNLRPKKRWNAGGCFKTAVYCPELAHL